MDLFVNCPEDSDLVQFSNKKLCFEKEHAYAGDFLMGDTKFTLDEKALVHIANETNRYIEAGNEVNLPVEHTTDPEKNRGKVYQFSVKRDVKGRMGLFSTVEFCDENAAKLALTAKTSIFCPGEHTDGKGVKYVRPVRHVALTDYPIIPGLEGFKPIAASLIKEPEMNEKDFVEKLAKSLSIQASSIEDLVKIFKPKEDPIKVSKAQVAMLSENRELKLSQLVQDGKITPAVEKQLKDVFCTEKVLTLCLSEDHEDNFNKVIEALKENDAIKLAEMTAPQGSRGKLLSPENNPMMAAAEKRANSLKG